MKLMSLNVLFLLALFAASAFSQVADEQNAFHLAQMFEQGGKFEDALRYYTDLQAQQPWNQGYFDGARRCLTSLKRYPEAIDLISKRMQKYPKDVQLPIWIGSLYFKVGDEGKALEYWN